MTTLRRGGEILVEALLRHGANRAFCVPGESYLAVLDALYDCRDRLTLHVCRHDGGAAYMAEAYGKLTGRPGLCFVTRGPGATNAAIAVHVARQDSTPMILFVGQVPRRHLGFEAFQEVDYAAFFGPIAKHVEQVDDASDIAEAVRRGFRLATTGRPGPVVIALPEDVLREEAQADDLVPAVPEPPRAPAPDALAAIRDALARARRPMVMIGGSVWTDPARADLVRFLDTSGLAACCSFRRQDVLDNDHPAYAGYLGLNADPRLFRRFGGADVLLVIGARLDEPTTQGFRLLDDARARALIHVYPSRAELGRVFTPTLAVECDIEPFVAALAALDITPGAGWAAQRKEARAEYLESLRPAPAARDDFADLGRIMEELEESLPEDAIIALDAGNFTAWPQRYLTYKRPGRLLAPVNGAMGYGAPAAVSAALTRPDSLVIGVIGDGGMLMNGMELATAVQYGARPIFLVINNNMYGTIRLHQERAFPRRPIATDLVNPDFKALAESLGAFGVCVERTGDFGPAFRAARKSGKAALIEIVTDPDILTPNFTISGLQAASD